MSSIRLGGATAGNSGGGGVGRGEVTKDTIKVVQEGTPLVLRQINPGSVTDDRTRSIAHGLGVMPDGVFVIAECTIANQGYAVGDVIDLSGIHSWTVRYDETNMWVAASNAGPWIQNKAGSASSGASRLAPGSWELTYIPYIFVDKQVVTDYTYGEEEAISATGEVAATSELKSISLYAGTSSIGSNWQELTLLRDLPVKGVLIEFRIDGVGGGGGAYATATAEELAETTATGTAPGNYVGSLPLKVMSIGDTGFGHDTMIVRKSDEADKIWVRLGRGTSGIWTIKSFVIETDVTVDVIVAGTDLVGSFLRKEDDFKVYTAADYQSIRNVNGKLVYIGRGEHDAHDKAVTYRDLTDGDFVGVVENVYDLFGQTHGKFYFDLRSGFAIRLVNGTSGFTGATGYYVFNPMGVNQNLVDNYSVAAADVAGPWQTAPAGGSYTGDLAWRNSVQTVGDVVSVAEGLGDVIVILGESKVVYIDTFTAAAVGDVAYPAIRIVPVYFNNPVAEFWLDGQTERWPATFPFTAVIDDDRARLQWTGVGGDTLGNLPPKAYFSTVSDWKNVLVPLADIDANKDVIGSATFRSREYWTAPAGIYGVKSRLAGEKVDESYRFGLVKVQAGTDDLVVADAVSDPSAEGTTFVGENISTGARIDLDELEIETGDQFTWVLVDPAPGSDSGLRGFFRLEKKQ